MENEIKQIEIQKKKAELQLIITATLASLGVTSAELTFHQAMQRYGIWFKENVEKGKLIPTRVGKGNSPTRWFSVEDILALRTCELERAVVILKK